MILVFGGTTEGRKAIKELEEAGKPFFYSTKTGEQDVTLHHGMRVDGAMDGEAMRTFCTRHGIRLIVDAAHPFATQLHQTVASVAEALRLPAIRFERIFPQRTNHLILCKDYADAVRKIDCHTLLATTGVQSISQLKPLETRGMRVIYRILQRESSIRQAHEQGATDDQLCFYEDGSTISTEADAILLKESGLSGGYEEKVKAAEAKGMKIYVIERPATPDIFLCVNGEHGLRRMVEKLLPEFYPLKSGLTTGTCATAAAIAATLRLLKNETPAEVEVTLPNGEQIPVSVGYGDDYAYVIKESGDDPDVTNGIEIRVKASPSQKASPSPSKGGGVWLDKATEISKQTSPPLEGLGEAIWLGEAIDIIGGQGVGTFTLPGFDYPPGEPAINKGPREMIRQNLLSLLSPLSTLHSPLSITISVPQGEEIARRTFNPRLGITGGISIIGVSGIIKPFSEEAFVDSIRKCMQVAAASGTRRVVINSGAKSERFVKALYPDLPRQAFVEYGNYIGETLKIAHELHIGQVTLGVMLGKAVKLAEGQLDTHSRKAVMNKVFIREMLHEAGCDVDVSGLTLARELWELLPQDALQRFAQVVIRHCTHHCQPLLPDGELTILLIDDNGKVYT